MRWAIALVGGVGLAGFGAFMVVVARVVGRPEGNDAGVAFARGIVDAALVVGILCVVIGVVAGVLGFFGMRRTERRRAAEAAASLAGDDAP